MNKFLAAIIAVTGVSLAAHASILFSPELGYSTGTQLTYKKSLTTYTFNESGVPLGFNLSYMANNGFSIGLSAQYTASGALAAAGGTTKDDAFTRTRAGLVLGAHLKSFVLSAGYDAMNTLTISKNAANLNSPDALYGTAAYASIGYHFSPRFTMALEYVTSAYTTYDQGATKGATISAANYSNLADSAMNILFKIPFGGKR